MVKLDILNYLEQAFEEKLPEQYELELGLDTKKHQIIILLRLFAQNQGLEIVDIDDNEASDVIVFEDAIILNGGKYEVNSDDYLAVLPFNRKKGIARKNLDCLINSILITLDEGQSDLLDFLTNDCEIFELKFECNFDLNLQDDMVLYPKF